MITVFNKCGKQTIVRQTKTKPLAETDMEKLLTSVAPQQFQIASVNPNFQLKFAKRSAIFVSEVVSFALLELCGIKPFCRFLSVSQDLWESELPWRTVIMQLNLSLPVGGRLEDMLQLQAPALSKTEVHPRSAILFCLKLDILCSDCDKPQLWEGYFKIRKIDDAKKGTTYICTHHELKLLVLCSC